MNIYNSTDYEDSRAIVSAKKQAGALLGLEFRKE